MSKKSVLVVASLAYDGIDTIENKVDNDFLKIENNNLIKELQALREHRKSDEISKRNEEQLKAQYQKLMDNFNNLRRDFDASKDLNNLQKTEIQKTKNLESLNQKLYTELQGVKQLKSDKKKSELS